VYFNQIAPYLNFYTSDVINQQLKLPGNMGGLRKEKQREGEEIKEREAEYQHFLIPIFITD